MPSQSEYIRLSMETNLFWARIMKEHAIFIESALTPVQEQPLLKARQFRQRYAVLLAETIRLSDGALTEDTLRSGQYYTRYTEAAEQEMTRLTGIDADSGLTQMTYNIKPAGTTPPGPSPEAAGQLGDRLLDLTKSFAAFKAGLYDSQTACNMSSGLYPSLIDHMLKEAQLYIVILEALQNGGEAAASEDEFRGFWTLDMAGHAGAMRGLFDPLEIHYFNEAHRFAQLFDTLSADPAPPEVLRETENLAVFKADTTQSLLECRVKAVMSPLLTDHMLREANHFTYGLERSP